MPEPNSDKAVKCGHCKQVPGTNPNCFCKLWKTHTVNGTIIYYGLCMVCNCIPSTNEDCGCVICCPYCGKTYQTNPECYACSRDIYILQESYIEFINTRRPKIEREDPRKETDADIHRAKPRGVRPAPWERQCRTLPVHWLSKASSIQIMTYTGVSSHTAQDYIRHLQQLTADSLEEEDFIIGGEGIIVEIDETKLGKRKYNRGHRVDGVWILCAV